MIGIRDEDRESGSENRKEPLVKIQNYIQSLLCKIEVIMDKQRKRVSPAVIKHIRDTKILILESQSEARIGAYLVLRDLKKLLFVTREEADILSEKNGWINIIMLNIIVV